MSSSYPSWIEIAVLTYCGWEASALFSNWTSTPSIRWGGAAFILWCLPVIVHQIRSVLNGTSKGCSYGLLGLAVGATLAGSLGQLNALRYLGLALALGGLLPYSWPMWIWLPTAASWFPALGWFARYISLTSIHFLQIAIALMGVVAMGYAQMRRGE